MSEAKSEVEYVIKTGRQIVEKKQVDNTEQLSSQIDAVKLLYNELGAQVNPIPPRFKPWLHVQFIACNYCMQFIACNKLHM